MTDSELSGLAHAISLAADPHTFEDVTVTTSVSGLYMTAIIAFSVVSFLFRIQKINVVLQFFISMCFLVLSLFLLNFSLSVILTFFIADVYLESSGCFAKYNPMLRQVFEPNRIRRNLNRPK
jgi:hypothetical protein